MKKANRFAGKVAFGCCTALSAALTGCVGYVEPPRPQAAYIPPPPAYVPSPVVYAPAPPVYVPPPVVQVEVSAPSVEVVIRTESDFYEPLTPYGRWEVVGGYGRCWIPGRVDPDWHPYAHGNWERTDAGWYWVSDEPWAWATYHYGRWDFTAEFGWYWVPQTQWAPAWVSWHEGGGYVGWAPLQPSARISVGGEVALNVALIAPRAFVFVEPRRFLEPVRPATVVVNNTTIINKTVNITNVKVVNNTVINEGPRTQVIEEASGRKLQAVPVRDLRRKQEAPVVAQQRIAAPAREKAEGSVQPPVRTEVAPAATKVPLDVPGRAKESEAAAQAQAQKTAKDLETKTQVDSARRTNEAAAKVLEEAHSKAKESERLAQLEAQQRGQELAKKAQAEAEKKAHGTPDLRPGKEPIVHPPVRTNTVKKGQQKKDEGKPSSPETPPAPPKPSP